MPDTPAASSRPATYANGRRRRQEIIEAAFDVFAQQGFQRMSMRRAAEEIGTSHTVLRHHFSSPEELLAAVLELREEREAPWRREVLATRGLVDGIAEVVRHNESTRGAVQLDVTLAAEGLQPGHPAHDYIVERDQRFHEAVVADLERERDAGRLRTDVDLDLVARQLAAMVAGLQVQWLYDDRIDMAAVLESYIALLQPPA